MPRFEQVHVVVDDATIAAGDPSQIISPVRWMSSIYDGPSIYEESLKRFSRPQRLVRALLLYCYEVNNGGHSQFFSNSSGIVWRDAKDAFEAVGLRRGAAIIEVAANRLGGCPSLDRVEREEEIERFQPDFEDVDNAFESLQAKQDVTAAIMVYIRSQPLAFHFSGMVERVILPPFLAK